MDSKTNKIFIILFISLILLLVFGLKVEAASATITVDKSKVEVGKPVKITVSGKGVQWNLKLKVDGEILKTDSELENFEANKNINFSATYTPKTEGTKEVTLEGSVTEFSDGSTIKSFTAKSVTVEKKKITEDKNTTTNQNTTSNKDSSTTNKDTTTAEKPKEKSSNANLSTLGVTPKEYDFSGFSKNKTSYNVTVPNDVDSLKVLYKTADSNAKVKVTGNTGFEVGSNNKITLKVTAEDGKTTKTYTIKVTKLAEDAEKPGNLIEEDDGLYLTSLELDGVTLSPEFAKDTYSYTATLSSTDITEVKVKAKANNEKAKIDISGNTELTEGENTINIIVRLEDSSVQTVYQVVVTKEVSTTNVESIAGEEKELSANDLVGTIKKYIKIIITVIISIILLIIILIILLKKENRRLRSENLNQKEDSDEEEYNVYKNDLDEFGDRNIESENLIETLYKQKNTNLYEEDLTESDKETLEEINKQTEEIFREKVKGQTVEYNNTDLYNEEFLEEKRKRRGKGKHSK